MALLSQAVFTKKQARDISEALQRHDRDIELLLQAMLVIGRKAGMTEEDIVKEIKGS